MTIDNEFPKMEIKKRMIIYSARGQILSKVGSVLMIYIFSFITTFITLYLVNKGNITSENNIDLFIIVLVLSTLFSFMVLIGPKEVFFFNPNWIIKQPTLQEAKNYLSKRKIEIENRVMDLDKEIKQQEEEKYALIKELILLQ